METFSLVNQIHFHIYVRPLCTRDSGGSAGAGGGGKEGAVNVECVAISKHWLVVGKHWSRVDRHLA